MALHSMLHAWFARHRTAGLASLVVAVSMTSTPALAQLYAREAPPNSAFVRVFNNTANSGVTVKIGDKTQPPLLPFTASPYIFVPPGEYAVKVGSHQKSVALDANHFYTAVDGDSDLSLLELSGVLNRLKSMIAIFNLMPATTVSMKTADGKASVFESVASGGTAQREINPLKLTFALFNGEQKISDLPPVSLDRGKVFSLFVSGSQASPVLVWNED